MQEKNQLVCTNIDWCSNLRMAHTNIYMNYIDRDIYHTYFRFSIPIDGYKWCIDQNKDMNKNCVTYNKSGGLDLLIYHLLNRLNFLTQTFLLQFLYSDQHVL